MKVKGIAILEFVKLVRREKNINWEKHLKPEDMEIVYSTVRPINWYPGDTYWRLHRAATIEVGKFNNQTSLFFGRVVAQSYIELYKHIMIKGDPAASLQGFINVWNMFYDFEGAPYKNSELEQNPGSIKITAYDYPSMLFHDMRMSFFYGVAGYYQEIAEQALGREVECKIRDKQDRYEITLTF